VRHFDTEGMLTARDFPTVVGDEAKTNVELAQGELVVLERLPITVTPVGGEVTVSNVRFDDDAIALTINSAGGAKVNIEGLAQMQVGPGEQQVSVKR
jgi:hypothetical protein